MEGEGVGQALLAIDDLPALVSLEMPTCLTQGGPLEPRGGAGL